MICFETGRGRARGAKIAAGRGRSAEPSHHLASEHSHQTQPGSPSVPQASQDPARASPPTSDPPGKHSGNTHFSKGHTADEVQTSKESSMVRSTAGGTSATKRKRRALLPDVRPDGTLEDASEPHMASLPSPSRRHRVLDTSPKRKAKAPSSQPDDDPTRQEEGDHDAAIDGSADQDDSHAGGRRTKRRLVRKDRGADSMPDEGPDYEAGPAARAKQRHVVVSEDEGELASGRHARPADDDPGKDAGSDGHEDGADSEATAASQNSHEENHELSHKDDHKADLPGKLSIGYTSSRRPAGQAEAIPAQTDSKLPNRQSQGHALASEPHRDSGHDLTQLPSSRDGPDPGNAAGLAPHDDDMAGGRSPMDVDGLIGAGGRGSNPDDGSMDAEEGRLSDHDDEVDDDDPFAAMLREVTGAEASKPRPVKPGATKSLPMQARVPSSRLSQPVHEQAEASGSHAPGAHASGLSTSAPKARFSQASKQPRPAMEKVQDDTADMHAAPAPMKIAEASQSPESVPMRDGVDATTTSGVGAKPAALQEVVPGRAAARSQASDPEQNSNADASRTSAMDSKTSAAQPTSIEPSSTRPDNGGPPPSKLSLRERLKQLRESGGSK